MFSLVRTSETHLQQLMGIRQFDDIVYSGRGL